MPPPVIGHLVIVGGKEIREYLVTRQEGKTPCSVVGIHESNKVLVDGAKS